MPPVAALNVDARLVGADLEQARGAAIGKHRVDDVFDIFEHRARGEVAKHADRRKILFEEVGVDMGAREPLLKSNRHAVHALQNLSLKHLLTELELEQVEHVVGRRVATLDQHFGPGLAPPRADLVDQIANLDQREGRRAGVDEGARSLDAPDQSFAHQFADRALRSDARDAVMGTKLVLGLEPVAGLQAARANAG